MKIKKSMWVVLVAAVLLVSSTTGVLAQGRAKVNVCHANGAGSFNLINVSESALPAHLAHGDAVPGDAVPGMAGYDFSSDCTPTFNGTVVNVTSCVSGFFPGIYLNPGEGLTFNFDVPGGIGELQLYFQSENLEPFFVNGVLNDGQDVHLYFYNVTQLTYTIVNPASNSFRLLGTYHLSCN
jgi:hypothetical protein